MKPSTRKNILREERARRERQLRQADRQPTSHRSIRTDNQDDSDPDFFDRIGDQE